MKNWLTHPVTVVVVCLFLTSCYSFNHITLPPDARAGDIRIANAIAGQVTTPIIGEAKAEVKPKVSQEVLCPVYTLPDVSAMPELPYKELAKARDNEALDAIQTKHIEELRQYIVDLKRQMKKSHDDYLSRCYSDAGVKK